MPKWPFNGKHMPYDKEVHKLGKKWDKKADDPKETKQPPKHKKS